MNYGFFLAKRTAPLQEALKTSEVPKLSIIELEIAEMMGPELVIPRL